MLKRTPFLEPYENNDFIIQLKAKFIFYTSVCILITMPFIIMYSGYIEYRNHISGYPFSTLIIIIELCSVLLVAGALFLLTYGYYHLAAHGILITTLATAWIILFIDTSPLVAKVDTIVFIFCILSMTPIAITRRQSGIIIYFLINAVMLVIFFYYLKTTLDVPDNIAIDYLLDNITALLFTCFTAYQVYTINQKALLKTETDIRERKMAEDALTASEERYRLIAENITDVIWTADMDLNFTYISPSVVHLLGESPEMIIPKKVSDILSPASLERSLQIFDRLSKYASPYEKSEQRAATVKLEIYHKDGHTLWTESKISFFQDTTRNISGLLGVTRDISDQRQALEEKKKLEAQLIQSQKMEAIGTLAGGIAHDFNNILAAIFGFAQLAEVYLPTNIGKVTDYVTQIQQASMRAKDLVQLILAFSRQSKPEMQPVAMDHLLEDTLKLLRASIPATIGIEHTIQESPCSVMANQTQIHQVIMNICTNAAHAMEQNGGVLSVSLATTMVSEAVAATIPDMTPGRFLKLTIQDTGHGMDADTLERIFEPYFTTKSPGEGTGLGLAVAHGIIKSHGAAISVVSEPGMGTVFHLYFPCADKTALVAAAHAHVKELPDPGRGRILLVDDEPSIVELGKEMLGVLGYDVVTTDDPLNALSLFEESPDDFDAVITDMTMPHLSGDQLAKKMMAIRPDIPIIVSTGFSKRLTSEMAREMGIKAYLLKPLSMVELSKALKTALAPPSPEETDDTA